jgi:hypothetical protein
MNKKKQKEINDIKRNKARRYMNETGGKKKEGKNEPPKAQPQAVKLYEVIGEDLSRRYDKFSRVRRGFKVESPISAYAG